MKLLDAARDVSRALTNHDIIFGCAANGQRLYGAVYLEFGFETRFGQLAYGKRLVAMNEIRRFPTTTSRQ